MDSTIIDTGSIKKLYLIISKFSSWKILSFEEKKICHAEKDSKEAGI